jgi:hypothetical protein
LDGLGTVFAAPKSFGVLGGSDNKAAPGTVVSGIRQALASRDMELLDQALHAPILPQDSCRALDSQLASPLLIVLTELVQRGYGDLRYLEWIRALLREHRNSLQGADAALETLRSVSDRAAHSLQRLLRLKGKLELLEQSSSGPSTGAASKGLLIWDEKKEGDAVPMDLESEEVPDSEDFDGSDVVDDEEDDEDEEEESS